MLRPVGVGPRQEHAELLAADAPDQVDLANHPLDGLRDDFQRLVSAFMPKTVVDVLEVIDVDDQQRAFALGLLAD